MNVYIFHKEKKETLWFFTQYIIMEMDIFTHMQTFCNSLCACNLDIVAHEVQRLQSHIRLQENLQVWVFAPYLYTLNQQLFQIPE